MSGNLPPPESPDGPPGGPQPPQQPQSSQPQSSQPQSSQPQSLESVLGSLAVRLAGLADAPLLDLLRADQSLRWGRGLGVPVEEYLGRLPGLAAREGVVLGLVEHEFVLRLGRRPEPTVEEFVRRFPGLGRRLADRLASPPTPRLAGGPNDGAITTPYTKLLEQPEPPRPPPGPDTDRPRGGTTEGGRRRPLRFGRYRVVATLGRGGFGVVYKGYDEELYRDVAIKVPLAHRVRAAEDVAAFLEEARILASLDHAGIVPVYDVGRTEDGTCYVVSKFIPGCDLAARLRAGRPTPAWAVAVVAAAAEALHHAHQHRLIHRDIKPANILLNEADQPVLVDFGLALRDEDYGLHHSPGGTPAYMSPEQAREEGHRIDRRTDVFSLGVVFYELLTGQRPFQADDRSTLLELVRRCEPAPPRQWDEALPRELERICLKALAKRPSDRYETAQELAADLLCFLSAGPATEGSAARLGGLPADIQGLQGPPSQSTEPEPAGPRVLPRGLRAFEAADAGFFLALLPGPRGRDGLPESVRFWKGPLEQTDPDRTFRVGLLYGPSGCGKSSLVRAGLLPRLADHVRTVFVEAAPVGSESSLARQLARVCPGIPADGTLAEQIGRLRRGRDLAAGRKVVLVIDQLEQWLSTHGDLAAAELTEALRQCDGGRVQALLLVRDDYLMAATRLFRELEVPLLEGRNEAALDLFEPRHARQVLAAFGRAYGTLPDGGLSPEQERFLDRAVGELTRDGRVVPVRLSLFADMMRRRPWTPAALRSLGGVDGLGERFLDEAFSPPTAPPERRAYQEAAQKVLAALLPAEGSSLKGSRQPYAVLRQTSGCATAADFDGLVGILDTELHLVTPTEPDAAADPHAATSAGTLAGTGTANESGSSQPSVHPSVPPSVQRRSYQLTHDYLVPNVRRWLAAQEHQTRAGRARRRLAELTEVWAPRRQARYLPTGGEWVSLALFTRRAQRSEPEQAMMAAAARHHLLRGAAAVGVLLVLLLAGLAAGHYGREHQRNQQAEALVSALEVADIDQVPVLLDRLAPYAARTAPLLRRIAQDEAEPPEHRLRARLALLRRGDEEPLDAVVARLVRAPAAEVGVLVRELKPWRGRVEEVLWQAVADDDARPDEKFRAACALAEYAPDDPRWANMGGWVVNHLLAEPPLVLDRWVSVLAPARGQLQPPLVAAYRSPARPRTERAIATSVLASWAESDTALLAELLLDAEPWQYRTLAALVEPQRELVAAAMRRAVAGEPPAGADPGDAARRQANAAFTLYRLGDPAPAWALLKHTLDPTARSRLVHAFASLDGDPVPLAVRWSVEPDGSVRRAQALALGEFPPERLPAPVREELTRQMLHVCRGQADPGLRSAAAWCLRRWKAEDRLRTEGEVPEPERGPRPRRPWYVNSQDHTLIVLDGQGQPTAPGTPGAGRLFAIAQDKTSLKQYLGLEPGRYHLCEPGREHEFPINTVSWLDAVRYCRWLSEQEHVPEEQMCYPPLDQIKSGMKLPADFARRTGYRLPTEAEWQLAALAGARTRRYYGEPDELLGFYAWFDGNSEGVLRPSGRLKPNDLGLVDVLGNTWEWCHGKAGEPAAAELDAGDVDEVANDTQRIARGAGYDHRARGVTAYQRDPYPANTRWHTIGFRIARTVPAKP